ncbi:prohibitin family protein [Catenovulum sp. 2E275]|uniref:prohibitin family protein n=1 Tax=Catenovulum sp. 2E275 TaxID=2980497 RepID=UPI0021D392FF|nr:prohibitin family protein [Catenovulum sp. 2E275]MCU4676915.1 prohibitin family protein [Catenovulum sp. 2E275]
MLSNSLKSQEKLNISNLNKAKIIALVVIAIVSLSIVMSAVYTVEEGHVGIVKRFGEAKYQENPGLHFKIPFIDSVEPIEVRTRKNAEKMASSTKEQMPVTIEVSVNWTADKEAALDLFRKYGGLTQFEQRILDPRFRSATKDTIPKYEAEQLIQDRALAIQGIEQRLIEEMAGFPVVVDNIQIENIELPAKYIQSIEIKQTEKNLAAAEEHKLERQRLEALREVNTADAKAQGIIKVAEAEAKAIVLKGEAEATAIEAKAKALRDNPLIVSLTEAQNWDGKLPTTIMGEGSLPILDMRDKK